MLDENNLFLRSLKSETDGRSGKINILNNLTPKRPQDGLTLEELKKISHVILQLRQQLRHR